MLMALGAHRVTGVPVQATCLAAFVIKSQELAEIGLMPVGAHADLFALLWGIFQINSTPLRTANNTLSVRITHFSATICSPIVLLR